MGGIIDAYRCIYATVLAIIEYPYYLFLLPVIYIYICMCVFMLRNMLFAE
jgi:hypothetical protein